VSTAAQAIEHLVATVRDRAALHDGDARTAMSAVLTELQVKPNDPSWADGRDVVGEAYEQLLSPAGRRALGQVFTPLWVARPMAEWLLADAPRLLLDPGVGSGSLLIGAAQVRAACQRSMTRLLGLDIDPLALTMAETTRHVRAIDRLELRQANFLLDVLPERPQGIICNPPYTRHQDLDPAEKAAIHDGLAQRFGRRFSRLASLHVLFLLRALEVSSDDGRIAFLTPAHWLDTNYAQEIKAALIERAHVEAIITFPVRGRVFNDAITTAGVTLIRKGSEGPTRVVRLRSMANPEIALRAAITGAVPHREIVLRATSLRSTGRRSVRSVTLGDLARVRRGIATGCNAFFTLSEARRRELDIDKTDLRPCVTSPRYVADDHLHREDLDALGDDIRRWLLDVDDMPALDTPLGRYLATARDEIKQRTLVRQRVKAGRPWFRVELGTEAPILFRYLNVSGARFVRNHARASPLNNWLVIQPHPGVDPDALFEILRTMEAAPLERGSRHYGKGLWKLEPSELRDIGLPTAAASLRPR
jgi:adenine-specific DNA-methyltransferase